jgi:phosphatidylglycerophosphate synthase
MTLKEIAEKRKKSPSEALESETWFSTNLARPFSKYVTWFSLKLGISANTVTIFSYLVSIFSAILFSVGNQTTFILGLFVLYVGFIIDCSDGEVARCTNKQSITGAYLDTLGHIIYNSFINFGLALGVYAQTGWYWILPIGFVSSVFYIPISRYSADHEILNKVRKNNFQSLLGQAQNETNDIDHSDVAISQLKRSVDTFRAIGFPFTATPYNIITIAIAIMLDIVSGTWSILGAPMNFKTVLLIYNATIVFVQQTASLINQVHGKNIEKELKELQQK